MAVQEAKESRQCWISEKGQVVGCRVLQSIRTGNVWLARSLEQGHTAMGKDAHNAMQTIEVRSSPSTPSLSDITASNDRSVGISPW